MILTFLPALAAGINFYPAGPDIALGPIEAGRYAGYAKLFNNFGIIAGLDFLGKSR